MKISFVPQRRDDQLVVEQVASDVLRIDGELFNFSDLPDGATIPAGTVPCAWIDGPIERVAGEVSLTLRLPVGPSPSLAVAFPEPITVTEPGPIALPHDPATEPQELPDVDA